MTRQDFVELLNDIANLLEKKGESVSSISSFREAAQIMLHPAADNRRVSLDDLIKLLPAERGKSQHGADYFRLISQKLPELVEEKDLVADLHAHSNWSDGKSSLRMMAEAACRRGLKILAITDHSISAPGLSVDQLHQQHKEIEKLQKEFGDRLTLLHGAEVNILPDGRLDYADDVLSELDIVVASLHTHLRQPRQVVTDRLLRAIDNPNVDIIAHPTGRYIPDGLMGADLQWERVFDAAYQCGVALEINASPNHLDMDEYHAMMAAESGCFISIDTDSHAAENMERVKNGVAIARCALVHPSQIISTWPLEKLRKWLNGHDRDTVIPPTQKRRTMMGSRILTRRHQ